MYNVFMTLFFRLKRIVLYPPFLLCGLASFVFLVSACGKVTQEVTQKKEPLSFELKGWVALTPPYNKSSKQALNPVFSPSNDLYEIGRAHV